MAPLKLPLVSKSPTSFRRENVLISWDNVVYLGIQLGPQDRLVIARFVSGPTTTLYMRTVRALRNFLDLNELPLYRIALDTIHNFGFILCPDSDTADAFRGHFAKVDGHNVFFEQIMSVSVLVVDLHLNQHKIDMVLMPRDCFFSLGIEEGPQDCLVAVRFHSDTLASNLFAHTVSGLRSVVDSAKVHLYRVAVDAVRKVGYILCPDVEAANAICGHNVTFGNDNGLLEKVENVQLLPFGDDVHQHKRSFICI
ncbi:unnamed protein product [Urochloa humidicola]